MVATNRSLTDYQLAYGNESEVGQGIKASGVPREEIWLTTKLDNPWHKRVQEGIDSSLKSLGTDYVDLYLMHWPSSTDPDDLKKHYPDWDFIKTWHEMQKLPATGKVKNIGVSNFGIRNLEKLLSDPGTTVCPPSSDVYLLFTDSNLSCRLSQPLTKSSSTQTTHPQSLLHTTHQRVSTAPVTLVSVAQTRLCTRTRPYCPSQKQRARLHNRYFLPGVFKRDGLSFQNPSTRNVLRRTTSLMVGN